MHSMVTWMPAWPRGWTIIWPNRSNSRSSARSWSDSRQERLVPDKAILDLSRLQEAFDDDVIGIADLLDMALATGRKHVAAMNEGVRSHTIEMVARAAHGIKGSASNVGAGNVTAVATEIETR